MAQSRAQPTPSVQANLVADGAAPTKGWTLESSGTPWRIDPSSATVTPGAGGAVARFTVSSDAGGFYVLSDSSIRRADQTPGDIELRVSVHQAGVADDRQPEPAVQTTVTAGETFEFDSFLGYLNPADAVEVRIGSAGDASGDVTSLNYSLARVPAIDVSRFGDATPGWSIMQTTADSSPAARATARPGTALRTVAGRSREALAVFRAPHSGYYALHDASAKLATGVGEARVFVGFNAVAKRVVPLTTSSTALNADLGYVAKGEVIAVSFVADADTDVSFVGTIVEWAPRRAPTRVVRGSDGYLDVLTPESTGQPIDIPTQRWIDLVPSGGDDLPRLREAIAKAQAIGGGWAGVRLASGATYMIGAAFTGGTIFDFKDTKQFVLDGNGATLHIASPELQRRGFNLFVVGEGSRGVVFADLTVTASFVPFTTGRIVGVTPEKGNTQTVTVEVAEGQPDPLKDILTKSRGEGYAYDPQIPGRLGFGTWSHYPGFGEDAQVKPTDRPGVFTHALTRTGSSLNVGDKWLVKNKGAGVIYLTTRGEAQDVTLSNIDGQAAGGGAALLGDVGHQHPQLPVRAGGHELDQFQRRRRARPRSRRRLDRRHDAARHLRRHHEHLRPHAGRHAR
ncbi:MAG: hypothetical protein QM770_06720 [Tepidisphaeraceae bacterium]